jgi:hypothetical protein
MLMAFFDVMEGWVLLTFSAVDGAIVPASGCLYRCRRGRWGALLLCGGLVLFWRGAYVCVSSFLDFDAMGVLVG